MNEREIAWFGHAERGKGAYWLERTYQNGYSPYADEIVIEASYRPDIDDMREFLADYGYDGIEDASDEEIAGMVKEEQSAFDEYVMAWLRDQADNRAEDYRC